MIYKLCFRVLFATFINIVLKYSCEYPVTTALQGRLALPATPWLVVARAT